MTVYLSKWGSSNIIKNGMEVLTEIVNSTKVCEQMMVKIFWFIKILFLVLPSSKTIIKQIYYFYYKKQTSKWSALSAYWNV